MVAQSFTTDSPVRICSTRWSGTGHLKINCDVSKDLYDAYTAPIEAAISSGSWEDLYGAYIRIREPDEVDLELKCENM